MHHHPLWFNNFGCSIHSGNFGAVIGRPHLTEGGAIASLGGYRCGCAWSSRETSAGESWKHQLDCTGLPEDPQRVRIVKMYEKFPLKKMVKDLDMCIKDPERTGLFSRVYWFVEGPLLFSCMFL